MAMANQAAASTTARLTLDQQRAADAWRCAQKNGTKEYSNLAKGLPALIMNSGLLQVMAFLHEKGEGSKEQQHCSMLAADMRAWLHRQGGMPERFEDFMQELMKANPRKFQAITVEAFAWLRWLRQLAAALSP